MSERLTHGEAIAAITRVLRHHDGEAVDDLEEIAEIVSKVPTLGAPVAIGADIVSDPMEETGIVAEIRRCGLAPEDGITHGMIGAVQSWMENQDEMGAEGLNYRTREGFRRAVASGLLNYEENPSLFEDDKELTDWTPERISGQADVLGFFRDLLAEGVDFHPDERAANIVTYSDGIRAFSVPEAARLDEIMQRCFWVCRRDGVDVYEIACQAMEERVEATQG